MFSTSFTQPGNSCGAATLAIAANQLGKQFQGKPVMVDVPTVNGLFAKTSDPILSNALGKTNAQDYYSTPEKIMQVAKDLGLTVTLYEKTELKTAVLPVDITGFKTKYVDAFNPSSADTATLKGLLTNKTYLQLLVYLDNVNTSMHWVLLQTDGNGNYGLYDTAYGKNYPLNSTQVDSLLAFNASITTGRQNNFYGIAILLQ